MGELLFQGIHHLATTPREDARQRDVDLLIRDGRVAAIGTDLCRTDPPRAGVDREVVDARRHLVMPGLINTHHHLFQTLTRNVPGTRDVPLFDWLVRLYPVWAGLDAEAVYCSTLLGCAELALTGCTTTSDHHYLFPQQAPADLLDVQVEAARRVGIRFHLTRGSMSRGVSQGGLPPDEVVQDEETILRDCERVVDRFHDPHDDAMLQVALAPCSPFSVTETLMRETARLARARGVRLHTHLAETEDENRWCLEHHGKRPLELMQDLEWLGPDVWFAHGIHFTDDEIETLARTGTGICHCPASNMRLGSGIARVRILRERGVPVGLGVDGSASNDTSDLLGEVRQAMLLARVRDGAPAFTALEALELATAGSARLLGREATLGRIAVGAPADLVLVRLDRVDLAGALSDPLTAVVFAGACHRVDATLVHGRFVVRDGRLVGIDEAELAATANRVAYRLLQRAGLRVPLPPAAGDAAH